MRINRFDISERILNLSLEIRYLVEENKIPVNVVIEDFEDVMLCDLKEEKDEDN